MAVELEIRDGDPWWMSPDIWAVPGTPEGPAGVPIAGEPTYLWARVRNNGTSDVQNATVRFYWADPSAGFDRSNANLVGTSFVNLGPGEVAEVLCLTPWVPVMVNGGHECVLAEAFHEPLDPLPATPDFQAPTDRHVAQRNLSVATAKSGFFMMNAQFFNPGRKDRAFKITVRQGKLAELKPLLATLGRIELPDQDGKLVKAGFSDERCPDVKQLADGAPAMDLKIRGEGVAMKTLAAQIDGPAALLHVEQWAEHNFGKKRERCLVGGFSVLALAGKEAK